MADVVKYGPKAWIRECERCASEFRYESTDIVEDRVPVLGWPVGLSISCPVCKHRCGIESPTPRYPDDRINPPSYGDLLYQLRWCIDTLEHSVEMARELGEDEEETEEVEERLKEIRALVEQANFRASGG